MNPLSQTLAAQPPLPHNHARYDAENRITQVDGGGTAKYVYDAEGRRVRKTVGTTSVDYLYDLNNHQISEMSSSGAWNRGEVYAGGRHLANYFASTTYFVHSDWLGTERSRVTFSGDPYEVCTSLPFGDALSCTASDPSPMHFTGKERDAESNLDDFETRYFSSQMGRFTSPGESLVGQYVSEPQSWNMYSYVQNNPINATDPDGQDCVYINDNSASVVRGDCKSDTDNGIFVNGTIDTKSGSYDSSTGTLSFNYTNDDTGAIGKGVIGNVYPSGGVSDADRFNAVAQGMRMAAPGVNLAANGLQAFGWVAAPELMALARCGAAGSGCSAGGTALALIPGLGDLKALGIAAHEEKAIGGVLKQIADGTTKGKEFLNATGNLPAKAAGYYREFTVPLAGQSGRGAARIVTGAGGEVYYTADHYLTFTRIK